MLCKKIVLNVRNDFCTQRVLPRLELVIFMYRTCNSMNILLSYCGSVDSKISASDKDLPVQVNFCQKLLFLHQLLCTEIDLTFRTIYVHSIFSPCSAKIRTSDKYLCICSENFYLLENAKQNKFRKKKLSIQES